MHRFESTHTLVPKLDVKKDEKEKKKDKDREKEKEKEKDKKKGSVRVRGSLTLDVSFAAKPLDFVPKHFGRPIAYAALLLTHSKRFYSSSPRRWRSSHYGARLLFTPQSFRR